jgi:hypothetical protein
MKYLLECPIQQNGYITYKGIKYHVVLYFDDVVAREVDKIIIDGLLSIPNNITDTVFFGYKK